MSEYAKFYLYKNLIVKYMNNLLQIFLILIYFAEALPKETNSSLSFGEHLEGIHFEGDSNNVFVILGATVSYLLHDIQNNEEFLH